MLCMIVGTWASGKTELASRLRKLMPEFVVFDWDTVIPGLSVAAGKDVWRDKSTWVGLRDIWVSITQVVAGGTKAVLFGPLTPTEFLEGKKWIELDVRCAYLDVEDEVLRQRLYLRHVSDLAVGKEIERAAVLRDSPYSRITARDGQLDRVVESTVNWIRSQSHFAAQNGPGASLH